MEIRDGDGGDAAAGEDAAAARARATATECRSGPYTRPTVKPIWR
jgi:hypothetical protein